MKVASFPAIGLTGAPIFQKLAYVMVPWTVPILVIGLWIALVAVVRWGFAPRLAKTPGGGAIIGLLWRLARVYGRIWHHTHIEQAHQIPPRPGERGLIIVANHTGAVDPVLIQCACPFVIRWMMAREMMVPELDWLWNLQPPIGVERRGGDPAALRRAIRCVRAGEAIGIFPEGRIIQPTGVIRPFHEGVGVLVARTGAPVLPVWVSGTPATDDIHKALLTPSSARVVFGEVLDFGRRMKSHDITHAIRRQLSEISGWPLNDEPMPPIPESNDPFHQMRAAFRSRTMIA